jgi:hypothetical protein
MRVHLYRAPDRVGFSFALRQNVGIVKSVNTLICNNKNFLFIGLGQSEPRMKGTLLVAFQFEPSSLCKQKTYTSTLTVILLCTMRSFGFQAHEKAS